MEQTSEIVQKSSDQSDLKLLDFEKSWISELNSHVNSLMVLARGLSVTKIVASFLYQYRNDSNINSSPFLIFLVNFSEQEFSAIEYYLKAKDGKLPLTLIKISATDTISNKRIDLYLKGGIFSVSYKALVLDLLTKRLSPSIITGFIVNNAQKVNEKSCESFLTQILRKDNPNAFIKCFSDKPTSVIRGGICGLESLMKSLQVNNLVLYPRIRKSIKDSLDSADHLKVIETNLKFSKKIEEMHKILIELMQACLDELKSQIKKFENLEGDLNEVLEVKKALLKSFIGCFRYLLGKNFVYLGQKAKVLLRNINEIKRLIWLLLNTDCVTFYAFLTDLRFNNDMSDNFSIFSYCDDETMKSIEHLHKLSKERIFQVVFQDQDHSDAEEDKSEERKSFHSNGKKRNQKGNQPRKTIEKEYGKLILRHLSLWNWFKEKTEKNIKDIKQFEKDFKMELIYETQPKLDNVISVLQNAEQQFLKSEGYKSYEQYEIKRLHETPKKKGNSKTKDQVQPEQVLGQEAQAIFLEKEGTRRQNNDSIIIAVKSLKLQVDIQRYLINYFVKSENGKGALEDKLRYFLVSHKEFQRRDHSISSPKQCNPFIIESYYQQKLSLLLEQKRDFQLKKMYNKTGQTTRKRPRFEMSGGDPKDYRIDVNEIQEDLVTEDLIQEIEEDEYKIHNIINGYNVYCENFYNNSEFEVALRKINPKIIILYEPYLDFMRVIESFNAERVKYGPAESATRDIEVHLIMYEESCEYYQYMNQVETEKKGFQRLIDIKSKLYIELKNFSLEQEASHMEKQEQLDNSRKGGVRPYQNLDQDIDKDIVAVDSREFSCLTPIFLHERGFWLIPLVLTVGDYVLSDEICIERKSVNTGDLFESFKSGRLLSQITNMNRFYKRPILLIEFDESVPFKLQDPAQDSAIGGEVNPTSIVSKLSLLTLHFPNLQIIWSKGPAHTADIFKELKRTQTGLSKDPDLQKIAKIGKVGDQGDNEAYEDEDDDFNRFLPMEFLKKLPGIDSNNINEIIRNIKNMVDLCAYPEEDLKKLIGPRNAKELKNFLEKKVETIKANDGEDL